MIKTILHILLVATLYILLRGLTQSGQPMARLNDEVKPIPFTQTKEAASEMTENSAFKKS